MEHYSHLVTACVIVLLPLVPAILLFKIFPTSSADANGPFAGLQWKLGGAFAGYMIVVLILVATVKQPENSDYEIWTVRGQVTPRGVATFNPNFLAVRVLPQPFVVEKDGSFEGQIVGKKTGEKVSFPRLIVDLTALCFGAKTIGFNDPKDRDIASATIKSMDQETRVIEVHPIALEGRGLTADGVGPCPVF